MIIMDEAHLTTFNKVFPFISDKTVCIGATATPLRTGKQECLSEFYTDMVQEIDTPQLIREGYLCNVHTYGILIETKGLKKVGEDYDTKQYYEQNKTYKGVVENYLRLVAGKKTILFASNIESSKQVCDEFNLNGVKAKHIDGNTPNNERIEILEWFKNTPTAVLCNCGILTAGYDEPSIEVVILYRATSSLPLYLQMVGRGSRKQAGKDFFYLLDFGNNVKRFDFWESPRLWNLTKAEKSTKVGASPIKQCKKCGALVVAKAVSCEYCGNAFPAKEKYDVDEVAKLVLLPKKNLLMQADMVEKVKLVKSKVLKASYVLHNLKTYKEAEEFCRLMGYKEGFIYENRDRYEVFGK
jgi:superfamily II DNA or RNA helicase